MGKVVKVLKSKWVLFALGIVLGALVVLGIRVAAYTPPKTTHYHANIAVYINGQREQFKDFNYYEETSGSGCMVNEPDNEDTPISRVHMHSSINDVVHVEDTRVSWGNFFTALGWNVGKGYIATRDTFYQNTEQSKVTYILNGKKVDDVANLIIGDQDKLLVDYGNQTADQVQKEYDKIENNALKSDQSKDPATCGSSKGRTMMSDRLRHMF